MDCRFYNDCAMSQSVPEVEVDPLLFGTGTPKASMGKDFFGGWGQYVSDMPEEVILHYPSDFVNEENGHPIPPMAPMKKNSGRWLLQQLITGRRIAICDGPTMETVEYFVYTSNDMIQRCYKDKDAILWNFEIIALNYFLARYCKPDTKWGIYSGDQIPTYFNPGDKIRWTKFGAKGIILGEQGTIATIRLKDGTIVHAHKGDVVYE